MEPKISIVVPVYKVEKFLDRCVESILTQTHTDFELILVDDGSPDRCPEICDEWASKDNRIRVIHKENGGVADAIDQGVRTAKGYYLAFVDGDDWVEKTFLETLYREIKQQDADAVQCNYQRVFATEKILHSFVYQILSAERITTELLPNMANDKLPNMAGVRWNKMYRTELVKNALDMIDRSISMGEDYMMLFAVFGQCRKIVVLDTPPLYNYYFHSASVCAAYNPRHKYEQKAYYLNLKHISEIYDCYQDNMDYLLNRRYVAFVYHCMESDWSKAEKKKEIKDILELIQPDAWPMVMRGPGTIFDRVGIFILRYKMVDLYLLISEIMKVIRSVCSDGNKTRKV